MPARKISPAEPVSQLRRVRIAECGEELVDFLKFCPELILDRPRFDYQRQTQLRRTVAHKLCEASHLLPKEYRFAIVEGWRSPSIQQRMYRTIWNTFRAEHPDWTEMRLKRTVNRYSAPNNPRVPPPHTTGGAVDLVLADASGKQVDLQSPYAADDSEGFAFHASKLSPVARRHREIMAAALQAAGITNYPSEYWHWSYGDQGWAYRHNELFAIYGAITPLDYASDPAEEIQAPLEFV